MSQIDIKELFNESRFPGGIKLLCIIIYTPIGFLLVLFRSILCLQLWLLSAVLPDCEALHLILNYGLALAFGIVVKISSGEKRDEQTRVVIANNISSLDHFVLSIAANTLTPSPLNLPNSLNNALGLQKMDMSSKDALVITIKRYLYSSKSSIALQPEFGTTNSQKALLKFNTWPFTIESSVQPVVLQASRPEFVDIKITSIASAWWTDIMWFMFVPYTIYNVTLLKVCRNIDADTLVREVEKVIAQVLKIETSAYTVSDKTEYEKRYVSEKVYNRNSQNRTLVNSQIVANIELQRMTQQVSEVFPLVPHNVIIKDLLKTRNIDVTITNILDGIVTYTPEVASTIHSSLRSQHSNYVLEINNTKTALTFQEKKAKMIAEAQERYLEKHRLKDC